MLDIDDVSTHFNGLESTSYVSTQKEYTSKYSLLNSEFHDLLGAAGD